MTIGVMMIEVIANFLSRYEHQGENKRSLIMTSLHSPSSIHLFGKDLSGYNRKVQFLLIASAVLIFHVAQGYVQV